MALVEVIYFCYDCKKRHSIKVDLDEKVVGKPCQEFEQQNDRRTKVEAALQKAKEGKIDE